MLGIVRQLGSKAFYQNPPICQRLDNGCRSDDRGLSGHTALTHCPSGRMQTTSFTMKLMQGKESAGRSDASSDRNDVRRFG